MAVYTQMVVWAENILIFQNQTIEIEEADNDADVATIPGGMQGVATGADQTILTVANAIPKAGADYDWETAKRNRTEVPIRIKQIGSDKELNGNFIVRSVSKSSSSGNPIVENLRLTSVGSPAPIFE